MRKPLLAIGIVLAFLLVGVLAYRQYIISQLQGRVLAQLTDPASANFKDLTMRSDWTLKGAAMCGEVNAKNRMSGYVGYRGFVVMVGYVRIDDEFDTEFKRTRPELSACNIIKIAPWWHLR